jgi:hypothetical protein
MIKINSSIKPRNLHVLSVLLNELSFLYFLERTEPLNFAIAYASTRKALKLTLTEFKAIYTAYKKQRGAV